MSGDHNAISTSELERHSSENDCWVVVNGKVYDLTKFAPEHPGGAEFIHRYAGKDGSRTYNQFHSPDLIENELAPDDKKGPLDEATVTKEWLEKQKEQTSNPDLDPSERPPLEALINLEDFEIAFSKSGAPKSWAYIWAGANDNLTLEANKSFWRKLWFRPRVMKDVSVVNTKMKMLGNEVSMPVFICPMGVAKVAGDEGELALGGGAANSGIIHCMSTTASFSVEDILSSAPNTQPFFFQLYVDRQRHKTEAVLKKVESYDQIKAIFVTVDLAVVSKREADERMRVFNIRTDVASGYIENNMNKVDKKGGGIARTQGSFIDWKLSWDDVAWLRKRVSKKIVLKGIQCAADARKALKLGCDGIVVSNHGGRALDNAPATILVLLELRRDCPEVFDKMEVFVDSGVRRGSDILKAICIGARGVGCGRPMQCAVAYGREGVETACEILKDELETAMRLCGVTDLESARGKMEYLNTSELQQYLPPRPPATSWFGALRSRL